MTGRATRPPLIVAACLSVAACAGPAAGPSAMQSSSVATRQPSAAYRPDRRDYTTFRKANPGLLEPNYLPFMVHRFPVDSAAGDALVFCRWAPGQMPLAVFVEPPVIAEHLVDEFSRHPPEAHARAVVDAIAEAMKVWQRELEGLVAFRRVETRDEAALVIRVIGERAPIGAPGKQRLGATEALVDACRAQGWDADADRMQIRFAVPELVIHLADATGLLPPDIVGRLALHELGHALGMRGHSASPGDLMYEMLDGSRLRDALSLQDVNSFVSLYQLPLGAHYADVLPGEAPRRPSPGPPSGEPQLAMAPHVDARLGFEIRLPFGWVRIQEPRGVFAANGPSWDYDASLRLFVWPAPSVEHFLECCSRALLAGTWFRHQAEVVVNGRRALRLNVEDAAGLLAQDYLFVELEGERVMMIASESPVEYQSAWQPWFQASLYSLEIWEQRSRRRLMKSRGSSGSVRGQGGVVEGVQEGVIEGVLTGRDAGRDAGLD